MSPTIFAMLTAIERKAQRDSAQHFFQLRAEGYSARRASYYSVRSCWPDAVTLLRTDMRYTPAVRTFYGSTALAAVGL